MSCPIVAGIIAQWLEAIPDLTRKQVVEAFAASCQHHDPTLTYPNNNYGYGEIDAEAGLDYLLSQYATSISAFPETLKKSELIFNLSGQRLAKPQKGINIINGKKVLK